MAAPDYITNLQDITLAESTTNWSALGGGGAGLGVGADFSMQGTFCVDKQITAAEKGQVYDFGTTISTGQNVYFYVWVFLATPGLSDSLQQRGLTVVLGTATNAYTQFHVEGNDTYGAAGRVAKCYPIRYKNDASTSPPYRTLVGSPGANPQWFGAVANITSSVKGANLGVDAIRYGDGIYITGGDSTQPATITGCATVNDNVNNRWGVLTSLGGTYELQGRLVIGQTTSSILTTGYFVDLNRAIVIPNTVHCDEDFSKVIVDYEGSTFNATNFTFTALGTGNRGQFLVNNQFSSVLLDNSSFTDFGFTNLASGVTGQTCTWRRSKTVIQSGAVLDSCIFEESDSSSYLLSDNPQNVSNCTFVSRGSGHGIEITKPGSYNFDGNIFTDFASVTGDLGTEAVYNNSAGAVTLNVTNATVPTYRNGVGATTTITASVSVTLQGMKDGTEVRILRAGTTTELDGIEQVVDGSFNNRSFSFSDEAGNFVDIVVHHTGYEYYRIGNYEIPGSTTFLPIDQQEDRVYTNP